MEKIDANYIYLGITRRCNLECKHCLRGCRENVDMDSELLDKIFRNISHIHELDIGGGEPFLVPEKIEEIARKIKQYGITVDKISITTNGTVLSPVILKAIETLINNSRASLSMRISHDVFHLLEINNKGLLSKFSKNKGEFESLLGYDPFEEAFVADNGTIFKIGRARNLTQEDMKNINDIVKYINNESERHIPEYRLSEFPNISQEQNAITLYNYGDGIIRVGGNIVVSAKGNLVLMDQEYSEEDENPLFGININNYPSLFEALQAYEQQQEEKRNQQRN